MENKDRDKMSRNTQSTDSGEINRETVRRPEESSDSNADFGQNIGRSENLGDEPSRRNGSMGGSGKGSSTGIGKGSKNQIDDSGRSGSSESEH